MPDNKAGNGDGISGPEYAAILLMALGESDAEGVLKYIEPEEVQSIGEAVNGLPKISQSAIAGALDKFVEDVQDESSLGGGQYFQDLLVRALGREKAGNVLAQIEQENRPIGLESLKWMSARSVAKIISNEHPQVIAAVLSVLQRSHAGEVLGFLPEDVRADVLVRVIELDSIHPEALEELDEIIAQSFQENPGHLLTDVGGIKTGAEILNVVPTAMEEKILEQIEELQEGMSEKIKAKMFIFESLLGADDRGMQTLLREVPNERLLLVLKGASEEMKDKVFKNMSKNAADLLKDDLEASGPVRLTEVEEAQREVLTIATKLTEEGRMMMAGSSDDFV